MKYPFLLAVGFLFSITAPAQTKVTGFKTTRVAVFKNGTCFLKKEAEVKPVNRKFIFAPPDNVLYGTFWLAIGNNAGLRSVSFKTDTLRIQKEVEELKDVLAANVGRTITLRRNTLIAGSNEVTGVLQAFNRSTQLMKLLLPNGKLLLSKADDVREVVADAQAPGTLKADSIAALATATLERDAETTTASIVGLHTGMSWHPSYFFKVVNDKEARLEMKATVVNEGEALLRTPLDLVVGNPAMFFEGKLDVITDLFDEDDDAPDNGVRQTRFAQMVNTHTQAINFRLSPENDEVVEEGNADRSTDGEKTNDLYYYKLGVQDIEAHSKLLLPVFAQTITYKDVYEVAVPALRMSEYSKSAVNDEKTPLTVFHSFRFTNNTKQPLTSASVFVMDEKENPLAQEELKYTPVGAESVIKLSKAIDVQAGNEEEVTDVVDNFKKIAKRYFRKATLKGKLRIANFQQKKIKINITKTVTGDVSAVSDGGKATRVKMTNYGLNPVTRITWEVELEPGKQQTLNYDYNMLVE
jgi:hypothetical protein